MDNLDKLVDLEISMIMEEAALYNRVNENVINAHGKDCKYKVNMTNNVANSDIKNRMRYRDECMKNWKRGGNKYGI